MKKKIIRICPVCLNELPEDSHSNRIYHDGCSDLAKVINSEISRLKKRLKPIIKEV